MNQELCLWHHIVNGHKIDGIDPRLLYKGIPSPNSLDSIPKKKLKPSSSLTVNNTASHLKLRYVLLKKKAALTQIVGIATVQHPVFSNT